MLDEMLYIQYFNKYISNWFSNYGDTDTDLALDLYLVSKIQMVNLQSSVTLGFRGRMWNDVDELAFPYFL